MADQEATKAATGPADDSKKTEVNPVVASTTAGAPIGAPAVVIPMPAVAASAPIKSAEPISPLSNDIAKILKDVKLPERRDTTQQKPIENKAAAFDTTLAGQAPGIPSRDAPPATASGNDALAVPAMVTSQDAKQTSETVVPVHTLKDDLQHVVREQKISLVRAVSLEQDRRAQKKTDRFDTPAPQHSKHIGIIFGICILFLVGTAALFGVYTVMQTRSTPPTAAPTSSILFAESSVAFPLDNSSPDDLKRNLASSIASLQGALGSITAIIPTTRVQNQDGTTGARPATFSEFMKAIGAHPPDELLRAVGDKFFFGVHVVDTNAPLFVIPVTSYDHAFAGMLTWEGTLNSDLSPIFPAVQTMMTDQSGLPATRKFTDTVMRNYDVRELKDDSGTVKLYYSFPSQNMLVIAESPYSFAEILSRLQAARQI